MNQLFPGGIHPHWSSFRNGFDPPADWDAVPVVHLVGAVGGGKADDFPAVKVSGTTAAQAVGRIGTQVTSGDVVQDAGPVPQGVAGVREQVAVEVFRSDEPGLNLEAGCTGVGRELFRIGEGTGRILAAMDGDQSGLRAQRTEDSEVIEIRQVMKLLPVRAEVGRVGWDSRIPCVQ